MAEWTQYFAFDILSELSFGDWLGNIESATDVDGLGHWVFLTLTGHAVLGWTYLQGHIIGFGPVQWLLNMSLYKRAGTQITKNPLKEVLAVCDLQIQLSYFPSSLLFVYALTVLLYRGS